MVPGDVIDFSLGYGQNGSYYCDSTLFTAIIRLTAMGAWLSPSERSLSVREDESEVTVNLLLTRGTNDPSREVSVDYQTADDTAVWNGGGMDTLNDTNTAPQRFYRVDVNMP